MEKIIIRTVAQSDENCSFDSKKHSVKWHEIKNGVKIYQRETFTDLNEARIFMLDKACELMNQGYDIEVIPYIN